MGRLYRARLGVDTRGLGEGEGGGYGRVEDGIADRVEGRHGIPAGRTRSYLTSVALVFWPPSARSAPSTGDCLRCDITREVVRTLGPSLLARGLDSTVVLVVGGAHPDADNTAAMTPFLLLFRSFLGPSRRAEAGR